MKTSSSTLLSKNQHLIIQIIQCLQMNFWYQKLEFQDEMDLPTYPVIVSSNWL